MSVITISRQLGTQGRTIARLTAERLGYRMIWREAINLAALRAGAPELALAMVDDLGLLEINLTEETNETYHRAVRQVMEELASKGQTVILGRAGQAILKGKPGVTHVRLYAPLEDRCNILSSTRGISIKSALAQIKTSDRNRQAYLKKNYQVRWDDPENYDLMINTGSIKTDIAVELIVSAHLQMLSGGTASFEESFIEHASP